MKVVFVGGSGIAALDTIRATAALAALPQAELRGIVRGANAAANRAGAEAWRRRFFNASFVDGPADVTVMLPRLPGGGFWHRSDDGLRMWWKPCAS